MSQLTDPRKEFGRAVTAITADNDRIVVLSADSGKSSGFGDFAKAYPERLRDSASWSRRSHRYRLRSGHHGIDSRLSPPSPRS